MVLKGSAFGGIVGGITSGGVEVGEFLQDLEWSVRDLAFWYFCPSILVFIVCGTVIVVFVFLSVVIFSCLALVLFSVCRCLPLVTVVKSGVLFKVVSSGLIEEGCEL